MGPNAADPNGEHWGVVVRSRGEPLWVPLPGTGVDRRWTDDDERLTTLVKTNLRSSVGGASSKMAPLLARLRSQRLEPLAGMLSDSRENPGPVRILIVLPSRAMAGIPIEALMLPHDTRSVSYAPSATLFRHLKQLDRPPAAAGMLAVGDPEFDHADKPNDDFPPLPGTRTEVVALTRIFQSANRPTRELLGTEASEQELERLATSGELGQFGFIHLATHGVIDESVPARRR